jgi:hypothetical protein
MSNDQDGNAADNTGQEVRLRQCGECMLCCKILGVQVLKKPRDSWCTLSAPHRGCTVHGTDQQPLACQSFNCLWVLATPSDMPDSLFPKDCHIVFSIAPDKETIIANVDRDYPKAWRTPEMNTLFDRLIASGKKVTVVVAGEYYHLKFEGKREEKPKAQPLDLLMPSKIALIVDQSSTKH